jgi:pimeloyl-ACP methyl ester carboxylesterase
MNAVDPDSNPWNEPLPATRFADLAGVRLAYIEWPGRPGAAPVICLPHLTGHKGSYAGLGPYLAPDFHVYALDLRGRGQSDRPADGYGFAYHTRDILAFADELGLESFLLVGHSFGATTGTYLASTNPRRVRGLVLLDGGADPREETLRAMYPTIHRLDSTFASADDYLASMRSLPFFQPWSAALEAYFRGETIVLPDGSVQPQSSAAAVARDLDMHFYYSMCLHFPALRCPVLFVRPGVGLLGERGHVFSETEARAITRHIPDCQRVDLPGVNHYTMLLHDHSPALPHIRAFLERPER